MKPHARAPVHVRPYPLYKLPSLLKRSLSVTQSANQSINELEERSSEKHFDFQGVESTNHTIGGSTRQPANQSINLTFLSLDDIFPIVNIRSINQSIHQIVFTCVKLLCISASYIAGLSLYDLIDQAINQSLNQSISESIDRFDDDESDESISQSINQSIKQSIIQSWLVTFCLSLLCLVLSVVVVRLSEKKFFDQLNREYQSIQLIDRSIRIRQAIYQSINQPYDQKAHNQSNGNAASQALGSQSSNQPFGRPISHTTSEPDIQSIKNLADEMHNNQHISRTLRPSLDQAIKDKRSTSQSADQSTESEEHREARHRLSQTINQSISQSNPQLMARLKNEEDKRAVTRALINQYDASNDESDDQSISQSIVDWVEEGLTPRQIVKRYQTINQSIDQSTNPLMDDLDDESNDSSPKQKNQPVDQSFNHLFAYRLADMTCYYLIFVSVYSINQSMNLTINHSFMDPATNQPIAHLNNQPTSQLLWTSIYTLILTCLVCLSIYLCEKRTQSINQSVVDCMRSASRSSHTRYGAARELDASAHQSLDPLNPLSQPNNHMIDLSTSHLHQLKVKQASWRKVTMYVASCLAYLEAYAVWSILQCFQQMFSHSTEPITPVTQAGNYTSDPTSEQLSTQSTNQPIYLWCSALISCLISGFVIVGFNATARSTLIRINQASSDPKSLNVESTPSTTSSIKQGIDQSPVALKSSLTRPLDVSASILRMLCSKRLVEYWTRQSSPSPDQSIEHLQVRIDVLEGSMVSLRMQTVIEALSYILALSFGAALTASLPAAPADAQTYNQSTTPSTNALIVYAVIISIVLAFATFGLESFVVKMERKSRERTQRVLLLHQKAVLAATQRAIKQQSTSQPNHESYHPFNNQLTARVDKKYHIDTAESALYILTKQQQASNALKTSQSSDEEWKRRDELKKRRHSNQPMNHSNNLSFLASPSPVPFSPPGRERQTSSPMPLLALPPSSNQSSPPPIHLSLSCPSSTESSPLLGPSRPQPTPLPHNASSIAPSINSSSSDSTHRAVLTLTFLEQYYTAIASTLMQGCALLVAYAWVGVFTYVLYPALRGWSVLWFVDDVLIKAVWAITTFAFYFVLIFVSARVFNREECLEL